MRALVKEVQRLTRKETLEEKEVLYSRGELEQIHGEAETDEWIAKGKLVPEEDEWGDICYRKVQNARIRQLEKANIAEQQ
eukprot:5870968-Alexandrium_andersonii.AAC.1